MATKKRSEVGSEKPEMKSEGEKVPQQTPDDRPAYNSEIGFGKIDYSKGAEPSGKGEPIKESQTVDDFIIEKLSAAPGDLGTGFRSIVEKTYVVDVEGEYVRLRKLLAIGDDRGERGAINHALDNAETNARRAFELYLTCKRESARVEAANATIKGAMREVANTALQREKNEGTRNKTITNDDVEAMAAQMHPDEWVAQAKRVTDAKTLVASTEDLASQWRSRCASLQAMLKSAR